MKNCTKFNFILLLPIFLLTVLSINTTQLLGEEISFFNTNIKDVLNTLSLEYGKSIIYESNIVGSVTFTISGEEIGFEKLLDLVLLPFNYYWTKVGEVYFVGISSPNSPAFGNVSSLYEIPLRCLSADKIITMLPKIFQDYISKGTSEKSILIFAPAPTASQIANFVIKLDKPVESKSIEIKIVDVSENFLKSYINEISLTTTPQQAPNILQIPFNNLSLSLFYANNKVSDENFQVIYEGTFNAINGMPLKVSTQRTITVNKFVDGKYTTINNTASIELSIAPRYLYDTCLIELNIQMNGIPSSNELTFETKGASFQTNLRIEYGKIQTIGSVSYDRSVQKEGGILILKDLPFIGPFFKRYYYENEKRYILFLVAINN
ncbi:MAG: hypothetical protein ACK4MM_07465 [Fervidobacterium sp.]